MADAVIVSAEVKLGAGQHNIKKSQRVDVAVTAGALGVFDSQIGQWLLGDSDSQASGKVTGMFLNDASAVQTSDVLLEGEVDLGAGSDVAEGVAYFLSSNGGKMAPAGDPLLASGKYLTFAGIGQANKRLAFKPLVGDVQIP